MIFHTMVNNQGTLMMYNLPCQSEWQNCIFVRSSVVHEWVRGREGGRGGGGGVSVGDWSGVPRLRGCNPD